MHHSNLTPVEPPILLGGQLPDVGFCFEGDTYGSRFGCFDATDGKDCADSYTGDAFVYGWVLVASPRNWYIRGMKITRTIDLGNTPPSLEYSRG